MNTHSFQELGLSSALTEAVSAEGYTSPTEIQARAVPHLLAGRDLLATAQTGTGKTAAFVLPLLQRLAAAGAQPHGDTKRKTGGGASSGPKKNGGRGGVARPKALILVPTRELAVQIDTSVATYGAHSAVTHTAVFGGAPKARQSAALRKRPTVLTATPGRLLDFIGEGQIDLSAVEVLILDEADRMLDMGFIPDVRRIAGMVENRRQTALFSATMPKAVEALASELLGDAARISVAPEALTVDTVKQSVLHLDHEHKTELLSQLIKDRGMFRVLVFTRTKHRASRVAKALFKAGIPSAEIHGNRTQNQRQAALERFRSGRVQALVGTDVAARGIDVDDITHVINFEIPNEPETYVHRIGRTARAGAEGEAISMCDSGELGDFRRIERLLQEPVSVDREHQYHREPARSGNRSASRSQGGTRNGGRGSGSRSGRSGGGKGAGKGAGGARGTGGGKRSGSGKGGGPRHRTRRG